jgi:hypothetical protein
MCVCVCVCECVYVCMCECVCERVSVCVCMSWPSVPVLSVSSIGDVRPSTKCSVEESGASSAFDQDNSDCMTLTYTVLHRIP